MANFITQQLKPKVASILSTPQSERIEATSSRLSLYETPPSTVISIEDFERYAIDRLRGTRFF